MKSIVKIIILIVATALAIGGVMVYAKTRVAPPVATESIDQYSKNLSDGIKLLEDAEFPNAADSLLWTLLNKTYIYVAESKLSEEAGDEMIAGVLSNYTPRFVEYAYDAFSKSRWSDAHHRQMLAAIQTLRGVEYHDGTAALKRDDLNALSKIQGIISDYRQARAISRQPVFRGVHDAQNTISLARKYAGSQYLSNCKDLVKDLNDVKSKIAASHYRHIQSKVNSLSQYRNHTQADYENILIPQVDAAVTEYDNKAVALYGSKRSVDPLWDKAREYYNESLEYYKNQ